MFTAKLIFWRIDFNLLQYGDNEHVVDLDNLDNSICNMFTGNGIAAKVNQIGLRIGAWNFQGFYSERAQETGVRQF